MIYPLMICSMMMKFYDRESFARSKKILAMQQASTKRRTIPFECVTAVRGSRIRRSIADVELHRPFPPIVAGNHRAPAKGLYDVIQQAGQPGASAVDELAALWLNEWFPCAVATLRLHSAPITPTGVARFIVSCSLLLNIAQLCLYADLTAGPRRAETASSF